jgi:hypothetical protein
MPGVQRSLRQKVFAGAAVVALLAGGALAAVSATGQKNTHKDRNTVRQARLADRAGGAGRIGHAHDLASAAAYLGVSSARLEGELRAGKTLAQVADATSGKSAAGLIEALVAAKRERLATAVGAKRITPAEQAKLLAAFGKRARALVQRQFAGAGKP